MGEKDRKRDNSGREREREREIVRETGVGERCRGGRERKIQGKERETKGEKERVRQRQRRKKNIIITNTKEFMEFYVVVLHSAERSEAEHDKCRATIHCRASIRLPNIVYIFFKRVINKSLQCI